MESTGDTTVLRNSYMDNSSSGTNQNYIIGNNETCCGGSTAVTDSQAFYTSDLKGSSAQSSMSNLDFNNVWQLVESSNNNATEYGYPILRNITSEQQLKLRNLYSD